MDDSNTFSEAFIPLPVGQLTTPTPAEPASTPANSISTPTAQFTDLPPEIRVMVERILIASGNLAIVTTNKLIHQETQPLIQEEAFSHVRIHVPKIPLSYLATMPRAPAQNIAITVDFTPRRYGPLSWADMHIEIRLILSFINTMAKTKNCILKILGLAPCMGEDGRKEMLEFFKPLAVFEHVYVTVVARDEEVPDTELGVRKAVDRAPAIARARNRAVYGLVKEMWGRDFGASIWHESKREEDRYLAFRP